MQDHVVYETSKLSENLWHSWRLLFQSLGVFFSWEAFLPQWCSLLSTHCCCESLVHEHRLCYQECNGDQIYNNKPGTSEGDSSIFICLLDSLSSDIGCHTATVGLKLAIKLGLVLISWSCSFAIELLGLQACSTKFNLEFLLPFTIYRWTSLLCISHEKHIVIGCHFFVNHLVQNN